MPILNALSAHPRRLPGHRVRAPFAVTQLAYNLIQWIWPDVADRQTFVRTQVLARNSGVEPVFQSIPEAPRPMAEAWAMQMLVNHDYEDRCYVARMSFLKTAKQEAQRRGERREIEWPAVYAGLVDWPFGDLDAMDVPLDVQSVVGSYLIDATSNGNPVAAQHLAMLTVDKFRTTYDEFGSV